MNRLIIILLALMALASCARRAGGDAIPIAPSLIADGEYPQICCHGGTYYLLSQQQPEGCILMKMADCIDSLATASPVVVWDCRDLNMWHIWSPELARIDGKWYIYFEADDGNTDNHQIYVIENPDESPLSGNWTLHGPIKTNAEWNYGIHPSTFIAGNEQYLLWSGWPQRRVETETQCIFLARMANPWTLETERRMISQPQHEWERQWINPDGTRPAYPIFVNENPEPIISNDGRTVFVAYSASGVWTPYCTIGLLHAGIDSDLTDPASWAKEPEPYTIIDQKHNHFEQLHNASFFRHKPNGAIQVLFQARDTLNQESSPKIYLTDFKY